MSLVGREKQLAELSAALDDVHHGRGRLLLLSGEAGVGKTLLARTALTASGHTIFRADAQPGAAPAYAQIVTVLRAFFNAAPNARAACGPLAPYLATLMPELGPAPSKSDRETLVEAVCVAFEVMARTQPCVVFLDDVHWADSATLELLPRLSQRLEALPMVCLCAYRSDEIPRDHALRWVRAQLRRADNVRELRIESLTADETAAVVQQRLGQPASAEVLQLIHERTDGLPLFVTELINSLRDGGYLRETPLGFALNDGAHLPLPETVRDLVLQNVARLSDATRAALDVAAVAGVAFDLDLVADLSGGPDDLADALEVGVIEEVSPTAAVFRHALVHEALYADISWARRRALHRQVAERLEARGASPAVVAVHWLAGRETDRARQSLVAAAHAADAMHSYRDAAQAARQALELWPEHGEEAERVQLLERLGTCAQLSGDLATAARAWREAAEAHGAVRALREQAGAQRQLAAVFELQGVWERALGAREAAAAAFAECDGLAEAALEHLAVARHLRAAGSYQPAMDQVALAEQLAQRCGRPELRALTLAHAGNLRARLGEFEIGLDHVRQALGVTLEHGLTAATTEVYRLLADTLEHAGEYPAARQMYVEATEFCARNGADVHANLCLACMTVVLRQVGDWPTAERICHEVQAAGVTNIQARAITAHMLGMLGALRGEPRHARQRLLEGASLARQIRLAPIELLSAWGLALVAENEGKRDVAADHCRWLLQRWADTQERHYVVPAFRWATSLLASLGAESDARACARALADIAAELGTAEAVAALNHALGEVSLLDGDANQAAHHLAQAHQAFTALELPWDRAHTALRAAHALHAAGRRPAALDLLADAYRVARNLNARPLAAAAAQAMADLGEPVDQRLGRRALRALGQTQLTRRELEVLGLVAMGQTDREIARTLVLSPRTVEMHVANSLSKLGCRSRAEAVRRASELQLLRESAPVP